MIWKYLDDLRAVMVSLLYSIYFFSFCRHRILIVCYFSARCSIYGRIEFSSGFFFFSFLHFVMHIQSVKLTRNAQNIRVNRES